MSFLIFEILLSKTLNIILFETKKPVSCKIENCPKYALFPLYNLIYPCLLSDD